MADYQPPQTVTAKNIHGDSIAVATEKLRWRPSGYAILLRDEAVLLLPQDGKYDLPGGGIELGEKPEAAVIRETFEETGLHIDRLSLAEVASSYFQMPNDETDFIQSIMLYYAAEIVGGELSRDNLDHFESQHIQLAEWVPLNRLSSLTLTSSIDWRPFVFRLAGKA